MQTADNTTYVLETVWFIDLSLSKISRSYTLIAIRFRVALHHSVCLGLRVILIINRVLLPCSDNTTIAGTPFNQKNSEWVEVMYLRILPKMLCWVGELAVFYWVTVIIKWPVRRLLPQWIFAISHSYLSVTNFLTRLVYTGGWLQVCSVLQCKTVQTDSESLAFNCVPQRLQLRQGTIEIKLEDQDCIHMSFLYLFFPFLFSNHSRCTKLTMSCD